MSGLDEILIGAFLTEKPRTKLPWELSDGERTTENKEDKGALEPSVVKEKAWNDWSRDTTLLKDQSRQEKARPDDRGIVSKEFGDEVMAKITLGEISIAEIANNYGHKKKAEPKPQVDEKKIHFFDLGEKFSGGNEATSSTLSSDISNRPSFLSETTSYPTKQTNKPSFLESTSSSNRSGLKDNTNTIVDSGFSESPRTPRASLDGISNQTIDVCLSPFGTSSAISTYNTYVTMADEKKAAKVMPWDEKKSETKAKGTHLLESPRADEVKLDVIDDTNTLFETEIDFSSPTTDSAGYTPSFAKTSSSDNKKSSTSAYSFFDNKSSDTKNSSLSTGKILKRNADGTLSFYDISSALSNSSDASVSGYTQLQSPSSYAPNTRSILNSSQFSCNKPYHLITNEEDMRKSCTVPRIAGQEKIIKNNSFGSDLNSENMLGKATVIKGDVAPNRVKTVSWAGVNVAQLSDVKSKPLLDNLSDKNLAQPSDVKSVPSLDNISDVSEYDTETTTNNINMNIEDRNTGFDGNRQIKTMPSSKFMDETHDKGNTQEVKPNTFIAKMDVISAKPENTCIQPTITMVKPKNDKSNHQDALLSLGLRVKDEIIEGEQDLHVIRNSSNCELSDSFSEPQCTNNSPMASSVSDDSLYSADEENKGPKSDIASIRDELRILKSYVYMRYVEKKDCLDFDITECQKIRDSIADELRAGRSDCTPASRTPKVDSVLANIPLQISDERTNGIFYDRNDDIEAIKGDLKFLVRFMYFDYIKKEYRDNLKCGINKLPSCCFFEQEPIISNTMTPSSNIAKGDSLRDCSDTSITEDTIIRHNWDRETNDNYYGLKRDIEAIRAYLAGNHKLYHTYNNDNTETTNGTNVQNSDPTHYTHTNTSMVNPAHHRRKPSTVIAIEPEHVQRERRKKRLERSMAIPQPSVADKMAIAYDWEEEKHTPYYGIKKEIASMKSSIADLKKQDIQHKSHICVLQPNPIAKQMLPEVPEQMDTSDRAEMRRMMKRMDRVLTAIEQLGTGTVTDDGHNRRKCMTKKSHFESDINGVTAQCIRCGKTMSKRKAIANKVKFQCIRCGRDMSPPPIGKTPKRKSSQSKVITGNTKDEAYNSGETSKRKRSPSKVITGITKEEADIRDGKPIIYKYPIPSDEYHKLADLIENHVDGIKEEQWKSLKKSKTIAKLLYKMNGGQDSVDPTDIEAYDVFKTVLKTTILQDQSQRDDGTSLMKQTTNNNNNKQSIQEMKKTMNNNNNKQSIQGVKKTMNNNNNKQSTQGVGTNDDIAIRKKRVGGNVPNNKYKAPRRNIVRKETASDNYTSLCHSGLAVQSSDVKPINRHSSYVVKENKDREKQRGTNNTTITNGHDYDTEVTNNQTYHKPNIVNVNNDRKKTRMRRSNDTGIINEDDSYTFKIRGREKKSKGRRFVNFLKGLFCCGRRSKGDDEDS